MRRFPPCRGILFFSMVVSLGMGCSGKGGGGKVPPEEAHAKKLAVLYMRSLSQNRGQPPKSEAEFRTLLASISKDQLEQLEVSNVDSLFISQRDQQPFVIRYGVTMGGAPAPGQQGSPQAPVLAYEKTGSGGQRLVVFLTGDSKLVDDAELKQLVPDAR